MANSLIDEILTPQRYLAEILKFMRGSSGETQTITVNTLESSGTTPTGAVSIELHLSPNFVGAINEIPYSGADWQVLGPFVASPGKTLLPLSIDRSAGSVNVITISNS